VAIADIYLLTLFSAKSINLFTAGVYFVLKTKESVAQVVKEYPAFYTDLSLQRAQ
jgi:hypothetical protein